MKKFKSKFITLLTILGFFLLEILIITYSTISVIIIGLLIIATLVYGGYLTFKDYIENKNSKTPKS